MIRPAELRDLDAIAELIRNSFDPALRPYMIYAQPGAAAFIGQYLRYPRLAADRVLLVAEDEAGVARGFVEFRLNGSAPAHLSYICVHSSLRGRGVAQSLIWAFVQKTGVRAVDLYVFEDNTAAIALYRKMGLETVGATAWFVRELPEAAIGAIPVVNLPAALAAFDRFGFCEFHVGTGADAVRIGRIGVKVLRCSNPASFVNDGLLSRLAAAFPEAGEALVIAPDHPGVGVIVNRSIHMTGLI